MDDARAVRMVQRVGDLDCVTQNLIDRQGTSPQALGQRLALFFWSNSFVTVDAFDEAVFLECFDVTALGVNPLGC